MNNNIVKIGVIGLGPRAETLLATLRSLPQNECQVTAASTPVHTDLNLLS